MSLDSPRKRKSSVAISAYFIGPVIAPDGTIEKADRQAIGYGYYGILVGAGFTTDPDGRRLIGIAQEPGQGGVNYPLIYPSDDVSLLIADMFLNYRDDNEQFVFPFSIKWLYGFGVDTAVGTPPTPNFSHEIEIQDALGQSVFSSLTSGTQFTSEDWDSRLRVVTWRQADDEQFLTVVYHTAWSPNDVPKYYPIYFEPTSATLAPRTLMRSPPRLRSLRVGLSLFTENELQFKNGFNTLLTPEGPSLVDGGRRTTQIEFDAVPGLGDGTFGPPCLEVRTDLKRINDVQPNARGQFFLDTGGCYRIERPVIEELSPAPNREVRVRDHTLQISNDCGPCCECEDFINVWEAIRRLRDRYADLVARAQAVRDQYHDNRARWGEQQACRLNNKLRLILQPSCPGQLGVAAGYCNNSDDCLVGVVIHVSFAYTDANDCPDLDGSTPATAVTTPTFSTVVCDSTFRGGFVDANRTGNRQYVKNQFYTLGGTYPHFWVHFPLVDPGAMAYVTFRLQFDGAQTDDTVEAIADAFQTGSQAVVENDSPVPGYTVGSGCTGAACKLPGVHLVDCPIKETSTLIPDCCDSSAVIT